MKKLGVYLLLVFALYQISAGGAAAAEIAADREGILYTQPLDAVRFYHSTHSAKQNLSCKRCHNGLFAMEALKVQEKKYFNMDALNKGKYCGICHNGKDSFASDTQCARCHVGVHGLEPVAKIRGKDIPAVKKIDSFGKEKVRFNHEAHSREAKCSGCHPKLFKVKQGDNKISMADHGQKRFCFTCHDGQKAFASDDCSRCHIQMPQMKKIIRLGHG
jgi:c(7)-type cytochrome triheme protein